MNRYYIQSVSLKGENFYAVNFETVIFTGTAIFSDYNTAKEYCRKTLFSLGFYHVYPVFEPCFSVIVDYYNQAIKEGGKLFTKISNKQVYISYNKTCK